MAHRLTAVFIYYDNPCALRRQVECWRTWRADLIDKIIVVDDASPRWPAATILRDYFLPPLQVYRIEKDIPWNMAGARNLGCSYGRDWIFTSDMDTLLYAADFERLVIKCFSPLEFHTLNRVSLPSDRRMLPSVASLAFHRSAFDQTGYDEDYAGSYGFEEFDFVERLTKMAVRRDHPEILLRFIPRWMIPDARTLNVERDASRNRRLFLAKRAAGFPRPKPGLRFGWKRITLPTLPPRCT